MSEIWKVIPGWPEYEASSYGRIKRIASASNGRGWAMIGRIMKMRVTSDGYHSLALSRNSKSKSLLAHYLIAISFIGPKPSAKHQIAHWDNDGLNNRPENLRWATSKENDADKERHGTRPRGIKGGHTTLTDADVRLIRSFYKRGVSQTMLASKFKVGGGCISRICSQQRRQNVQ